LHDRVRTKASIFRKGGVIPTVFYKIVAKQETRTFNTAGLVQNALCTIFRKACTHPMHCVAKRNPILVHVFGVSVRGNNLIARIKSLVHFREVVATDYVVRVKDKIPLEACRN
jgi:hypothetical protein